MKEINHQDIPRIIQSQSLKIRNRDHTRPFAIHGLDAIYYKRCMLYTINDLTTGPTKFEPTSIKQSKSINLFRSDSIN